MSATGNIATAVITGHHAYDVVGLQAMFRNIPGIDVYPQNIEDFVNDTGGSSRFAVRRKIDYDVVVFYNFHQPTPSSVGTAFDPTMMAVLEGLGDTEQGILMLHHAILAFRDWDRWDDICGMTGRVVTGPAFKNQRVPIEIADDTHPITQGLSSWEIVDEVYPIGDADESNDILLTTSHPRSMRTIAWARNFGKARVFCYQSGHDRKAFNDLGFRTVIGRGIRWLAGQI